METQIQIKIKKEDKELIKRACKISGVGHSTFARMSALEKARQVLKENGAVENGI